MSTSFHNLSDEGANFVSAFGHIEKMMKGMRGGGGGGGGGEDNSLNPSKRQRISALSSRNGPATATVAATATASLALGRDTWPHDRPFQTIRRRLRLIVR
uniref:Uncharacterized protein n=1 Tax=Vespula pensylvanica TaxID=30213 RepID=A0A834PC54_VESPE|nr:hypothetical protein H0235_003459 [Vespula pensylvanica]